MQFDRARHLLNVPPRLRYGSLPAADAPRWAERVRGVVCRALDMDAVEPFTEVSRTTSRRGSVQMDQYVFAAPGREAFRGTVLRPMRSGSMPAVLVCPGRNAAIDRVTGVEPPDHPGRDVAAALAERGIASLTFDYGLLAALDATLVRGRDEVNLLGLALGLVGSSPLALLVEDALRAFAWLSSQGWAVRGGIGFFGHSLGAHVALHAALASPARVPLALASFLGSYASIFGDRASGGAAHALPGMLRFADLHDLVAAHLPGHLQVQIGERDELVPQDGALAAAETVRRAYDDASAGECVEIARLPMGHATDTARACDFFEQTLADGARAGAVRRRVPAARIHFPIEARREILERVDESLATGSLTLGPNGRRFEDLICRHTAAPHAVAVSSGTAALEVALRAAGVTGGEVLIPANTFFATALAAMHAGARVRFVDIEPVGLGMDPRGLRRELDRTPDAAAVIVVHIAGIVPPSVAEVIAICRERGIPLVEDAAHALGSTLDGRAAGTLGEYAAFSMYPTKVATSGEGGVLTTASEEGAAHARLLRDQGKESFFANVHRHAGYNWRMSEVHASIGIAHLERLDDMLAERRRLAAIYDALLADCPGVRPFPVPATSGSNYYKYVALLEAGIDRRALKAALRAHGIDLSGEVYEMPCSAQPYFEGRYAARDFPRADEFCRRHICLPLFPGLDEESQHAVVDALRRELAAAAAPAHALQQEDR